MSDLNQGCVCVCVWFVSRLNLGSREGVSLFETHLCSRHTFVLDTPLTGLEQKECLEVLFVTHCNTLYHTTTGCRAEKLCLRRIATHCTTLQHTAPRCNTLRHTACTSHGAGRRVVVGRGSLWRCLVCPPSRVTLCVCMCVRVCVGVCVCVSV